MSSEWRSIAFEMRIHPPWEWEETGREVGEDQRRLQLCSASLACWQVVASAGSESHIVSSPFKPNHKHPDSPISFSHFQKSCERRNNKPELHFTYSSFHMLSLNWQRFKILLDHCSQQNLQRAMKARDLVNDVRWKHLIIMMRDLKKTKFFLGTWR